MQGENLRAHPVKIGGRKFRWRGRKDTVAAFEGQKRSTDVIGNAGRAIKIATGETRQAPENDREGKPALFLADAEGTYAST